MMLKEQLKKVKNKTKDFCKKHKKGLVIGAVSSTAGVLEVIAKVNKDSSKDDLEYSNKFFRNASDNELEIEREKVRQKRNNSYDDEEYDKYYNLLNKFDNVMSKRAWGEEEPTAPSYHSEHGWYLPEDDD